MPVYRKFEEMPVWIAAKDLAVWIYSITDGEKLRRDFSLKDQIRRAALSVSNNIAEGFERGSTKEFIQFMYVARGSVGELRSMLTVARELDYLPTDDAGEGISQCVAIARQLSAFIESLKAEP